MRGLREPVPAAEDHAKIQKRILNPASLEIKGFKAGDFSFEEIRGRFGDATQVSRGDGDVGRDQLCYLNGVGDEYLIFELGELESNFYLIKKKRDWKGSEHCLRSEKLSHLRTKSGLHIGATIAQVERILGEPSYRSTDKLIYRFQTKVKKSAEILEKFKSVPHDQLPEEWDYSAYVEARFEHGKLTSLGVSKMDFVW